MDHDQLRRVDVGVNPQETVWLDQSGCRYLGTGAHVRRKSNDSAWFKRLSLQFPGNRSGNGYFEMIRSVEGDGRVAALEVVYCTLSQSPFPPLAGSSASPLLIMY